MATSPPEADDVGAVALDDDVRLVAALRAGDEAAFVALIDRYQQSLIRLALLYVDSRAVAEEVVQETWLGVLQGLGRFEARSSLKTWLFRILTNRAKTRGAREGRTIPFSAVWNQDAEPDEPAVDPARFHAAGPGQGHWAAPPRPWDETPEALLLSDELQAQVRTAIAVLPASQREVITLRDIEGWSGSDVCNALGLTETNQRVLLHRARAKVRRALEQYLADKKTWA